ncbi:hypothetical protein [Kitasatospora phosalacinea]|uniref:DUF8175 domain-containing protein n=1 Tax=Kitasatospora phosalacinea TaxID=2065 RepID=A0A9W6PC18_9ACTN|nr:hypothetical protein [Kitasatospora phosalacinea]GLW53034.1 hypothetical protein Kpho01_10450 [Kitasatospora phosalacinea]
MNQFLDRRPRRRVLPLLLLGIVAFLGAIAVGVAIESDSGPRAPRVYTPPAAIPAPGSVTGVEPSGETAASDLAGPLQLIRGARLVNGISVGYPHSSVGAVSAAVEYWRQLGSTLEPDRAAAVARIVAVPNWSDAADTLAKGPVATRKALKVPTSGQLDPGTSVVLNPVEYQVRSVGPDSIQVLLLSTYTTSVPGAGMQTRMGVYPLDLVWSGDDWRVPAPSGTSTTDYTSLIAEPGSPQASAKGWNELKR